MKTVALLFGGNSPEHDISIMSCKNVYSAINKEKYNILLIKISRAGEWILCNANFEEKEKLEFDSKLQLKTSSASHLLVTHSFTDTGKRWKKLLVDLFFPVMHGPNCEDGKLQALLELMRKPYIGSDSKSSMLGMDKILQKEILKHHNIPMLSYISYQKENIISPLNIAENLRLAGLHYPIFIKPANGGSSIGISKVKRDKKLRDAINEALKYDTRIIIEQDLDTPRELECAILGDKAIEVGEIIPTAEFYDYNDKYFNGKAKAQVPAKINDELKEKIKDYSEKIFKILGCRHFARVDFLYKDEKIYFNEINTIPGFTNISMYPMICKVKNISYQQLIEQLIDYATLSK